MKIVEKMMEDKTNTFSRKEKILLWISLLFIVTLAIPALLVADHTNMESIYFLLMVAIGVYVQHYIALKYKKHLEKMMKNQDDEKSK